LSLYFNAYDQVCSIICCAVKYPIVSFSIGIPATFLWGGFERNDKTTKIPLEHGDVVVFGGEDRLRFHGVEPIQQNVHEKVGEVRINLTFRKAD